MGTFKIPLFYPQDTHVTRYGQSNVRFVLSTFNFLYKPKIRIKVTCVNIKTPVGTLKHHLFTHSIPTLNRMLKPMAYSCSAPLIYPINIKSGLNLHALVLKHAWVPYKYQLSTHRIPTLGRMVKAMSDPCSAPSIYLINLKSGLKLHTLPLKHAWVP